jgi:6-phosphogluconate dehydrogenase
MQLGIVGLGRMGGNIARRLMRTGHTVVVHDRDLQAIEALAREGAAGVSNIPAMVRGLRKPRAVWLMLPAGDATERALGDVASQLEADDVILDGGNSFWKEDSRRAAMLDRHGIHYLDVGTSGGVWGLERGYCLMVGGEKAVVDRLEPIFKALAMEGGFVHAGPSGAGHFVKMIHNGIEYGMMQAYAEGFDILRNATSEHVAPAERLDLDVAAIAETWRHGSVISSWLLDLAAAALAKDPGLSKYSGVVADSGEGRWALMAAIEERVPAEVLAAALHARFRSQKDHTYAEKLLSALREGFGGHQEKTGTEKPGTDPVFRNGD